MLTKKKFTKQMGKTIRELREKKRLSQEELAHRVGVYRTYIGHIENARYNPSAYFLYKVITLLEADPREFFK